MCLSFSNLFIKLELENVRSIIYLLYQYGGWNSQLAFMGTQDFLIWREVWVLFSKCINIFGYSSGKYSFYPKLDKIFKIK